MRRTWQEEVTVELSPSDRLDIQTGEMVGKALREFTEQVGGITNPSRLDIRVEFSTIRVRSMMDELPTGVALVGVVSMQYEDGE